MKKYTIGLDYGTLSARAVLVDVTTGEEKATSVFEYPHGVMDKAMPDGTALPDDFALQHPGDYLDALLHIVNGIMKESGVSPEEIGGIGVDFTASTVMPVYENGEPLCFADKYKNEPHAYVKLWKHHAAQPQAERFLSVAKERGEKWIGRYGNQISSEWLFPKVLEILEERPDIYNEAERFTEAGDWLVQMLTGEEKHSSCQAGYKAFYSKKELYPDNEYMKAVNPLLDGIVGTKVSEKVIPAGSRAGVLSEKGALLTGLIPGIPVAAASIDAHAALPAAGITGPGKMLMIIGTSTCHIMMADEMKIVPGISGVVEDGVCEGYYGYEAGQAAVGDIFDWFVKNCVPYAYTKEAEEKGIGIHKLLREKAQNKKVGESGIIALDWWNGNRSILSDSELSGLILGMKLTTAPEDIYRALIEATAFGTRKIIETFREHGVRIDKLCAAGGIAKKDDMTMQIYADVTGMPIEVAKSLQGCALGSAMFAAVAGGMCNSLDEAAKTMSGIEEKKYIPIEENVKAYDKLYEEYTLLHDYFGKNEMLMHRLKKI